jgi:hypothetical protein
MTTPHGPRATPLSTALPGTWKLVSRVDVAEDGRPRVDPALGSDPVALLYYDRSRHFAAQFMKRDRTTPTPVAASAGVNNSRAQDGYDAYFGEYSVDDATGMVTQRLIGSLSRENVGLVLTRAMTVEGDRLTIELHTTSLEGEPVKRTLLWERVG